MTRYYDASGRRVPDPRDGMVPASSCVLALIIGMLVGALILLTCVYVVGPSTTHTTADVTYISSFGTIGDHGDVQVYSWTDDDGKEYLVPVYGSTVGGICRRGDE